MTKSTPKTTRGKDSREHILQITRRLATQANIKEITLDQISREAGLAKTSILWHFGSKENLILEVVDQVFLDFERRVVTGFSPELTRIEKLKFFLRRYAEFLEESPDLPGVCFSSVFDNSTPPSAAQKMRDTYERQIDALRQHLGISKYAAVALIGMLDGVVIQSLINPDSVNLVEAFDVIARLGEALLAETDAQ